MRLQSIINYFSCPHSCRSLCDFACRFEYEMWTEEFLIKVDTFSSPQKVACLCALLLFCMITWHNFLCNSWIDSSTRRNSNEDWLMDALMGRKCDQLVGWRESHEWSQVSLSFSATSWHFFIAERKKSPSKYRSWAVCYVFKLHHHHTSLNKTIWLKDPIGSLWSRKKVSHNWRTTMTVVSEKAKFSQTPRRTFYDENDMKSTTKSMTVNQTSWAFYLVSLFSLELVTRFVLALRFLKELKIWN